MDGEKNQVLIPGANELVLDSWGFGKINNATGNSTFSNGANIPAMNRSTALLGAAYDKMKPNLFTRRRPTYYDVPQSNIMDVKALGAVGDGVTDDTFALNSILAGAANTSSIVYIPYGICK
jgi:polygalacturonase